MPGKTADNIIGRRIKFFLGRHDMTQLELSRKIGVSTATVSDWINGNKTPRLKNISAMCDVFRCQLADLMDADSAAENIGYSPVEQAIIRAYRDASDDTQTAVRAVLGVRIDGI